MSSTQLRWRVIGALVVMLCAPPACTGGPDGVGESDTSSLAIIHGETLASGEYPAVGAVHVPGRGTCTGTLIAPDVVLTAAHCLRYPAFATSFVTAADVDAATPAERFRGVRVVVHPDARTTGAPPRWHTDLALLLLEREVPGVQPMELATTGDASLGDAGEVVIIGYGRDSDGIDHATVAATGIKRGATTRVRSVDDHDLVVGTEGDAARLCHGDSGGPALIAAQGGGPPVWRVAGVTSRLYSEQAGCSDSAVATRIAPHGDWIRELLAARPAASN